MFDTILIPVIITVATTIAGFLTKKAIAAHQKQQEVNAALKAGLQSLLRYRIIQTYEESCKNGYIPIYALDGINACYSAYEDLGSNGVINGIMDKLRALPNAPLERKEGE